MGKVAEIFGPAQSGKSAFSYQMMRYFQEDYPHGRVWIIDSEKSLDFIRMKHVFGIQLEPTEDNPKPVTVMQAASLENGFNILQRACDAGVNEDGTEKYPILVVWDTIAVAKPESELIAAYNDDYADLGINSVGLTLRARVMEQGLATFMSKMYGRPLTVLLINQVRTSGFGSWKGPTTKNSSGGNALKHYIHYRFYIEKKKRIVEERGKNKMEIGTESLLEISKSKFFPAPVKGHLQIFDQHGGIILPKEEIFNLAKEVGVLKQAHAWWYWEGDEKNKFRFADIQKDPAWRARAYEEVTRYFRTEYRTIDLMYRERGLTLGEPIEESSPSGDQFSWISSHDPFAQSRNI